MICDHEKREFLRSNTSVNKFNAEKYPYRYITRKVVLPLKLVHKYLSFQLAHNGAKTLATKPFSEYITKHIFKCQKGIQIEPKHCFLDKFL